MVFAIYINESEKSMSPFFTISEKLENLSKEVLQEIAPVFRRMEEITEYNQQKVLSSFIHHHISERHFVPTTGYGYGDQGRDELDKLFAQVMGAEDALVRHSIVSGTHAITIALFGLLRPGDTLLASTGAPYDTLDSVIGHKTKCSGSLAEYGVNYKEVPLNQEQMPDLAGIAKALQEDKTIKVVHIQRSRGYNLRPSLKVEDIGEIVNAVRSVSKDVIIFVDNCYGEFVQTREPTEVGADLIAGSLIKNAGGGIAENGGYVCGKARYVEQCAYRMTTPGLGREVGASLGHNRSLYMGLFHAPHVVGEALKTAVYTAAMFEKMGFLTSPKSTELRGDIIQTVCFGEPKGLIAFCQGLQSGSPIDSNVTPEPWDMPGYDTPVIMAAGAFTAGSSIELSADAPLREPYAAYMQGGLNCHSGKVGIMLAIQSMIDKGTITL